jgi:hypothetical protein
VSVTLYGNRYFGVEGLWHHFFESSVNDQGNRLKGDRFQAGAFLDFSFVRVYVDYFHEQELASNPDLQAAYPIRSGVLGGVRLFF